ncbi:MAG: HAMP domain-containing protein, partial [Bacteroidetes bacterium]
MNFWLDAKEDRIEEIVARLTQADRKIQVASNLERDFFTDETINPNFYKTRQSDYLNKHKQLTEEINKELSYLNSMEEIEHFDISSNIDTLIMQFGNYELVFEKMVELIKFRGFKDYGVEGDMRHYIHEIENAKYQPDLANLLTIRRHEKDFIIRKDSNYLRKHTQSVHEFKTKVARIPDITQKVSMLSLIEKYQDAFKLLVQTEEKIGYDHHRGMKKELNDISTDIAKRIEQVNEVILNTAEVMRYNIRFALVVIMILGVGVNVILAVLITKMLSKPITSLSASIHEVIKHDFSESVYVTQINSKDEIALLAKDFAFMLEKVQGNIAEIKDKSEKIEHKQRLLMDSIRYAQQIQEAILPDSEDLKIFNDNYFIIYKPLHVVSGDFYWFATKNEKSFLAVVDCTGHGVPGAFMSMIGNTLLNKIVTQNKVFEPAKILERLHKEVKESLRQDEKKNDDGMDISICVFDNAQFGQETLRMIFAGAKSSLIYTSNNEVMQMKGVNRSVGGKLKSELRPFTSSIIDLQKNDMIYLFSDGFIDQKDAFGEKFGKQRLRSLIQEVHHLGIKEQEERFNEELTLQLLEQ